MNEIIGKVVEELKKDTPDISYIRGMLETVLAMNGSLERSSAVEHRIVNPPATGSNPVAPALDDQALLEAGVASAIKSMPPMIEG